MSKKSNVRSFRFSDEVAAILEGMKGQSMNDNFEQLVLECYYKLPDLQKQHKKLEKEIADQRKQLRHMVYDLAPSICRLPSYVDAVLHDYEMLKGQLDHVTQILTPAPDLAEENV